MKESKKERRKQEVKEASPINIAAVYHLTVPLATLLLLLLL